MVQMLTLELYNFLRVLDLFPAYCTNLLRFIMLNRFHIIPLTDRAKVLFALPHDLIEGLLVLWLLVKDSSILREPFLSCFFAYILCRCVACWLLVDRQPTVALSIGTKSIGIID